MRQGRGTGIYRDYLPWHRVGRGDPASVGRSHLMMWRERHRELLSDGEMVGLLFATMLTNLGDLREQHKLSLEDGQFELSEYDIRFSDHLVPGTRSIAKKLGLKHPRVNGDGRSEYWQMSTDQVLVLKQDPGELELLAVAYKPDRWLSKRGQELLRIEKEYWAARCVTWILITPDIYEESVGVTLSRVAPWALGAQASPQAVEAAVAIANHCLGHSWTYTHDVIAEYLGDADLAKRAFWQAVWFGILPVNLRMGWRPHLPLQILHADCFAALNPVASRRSAWN